jgi:3-phosphoshikimate 1-carboxyvinyltransferase
MGVQFEEKVYRDRGPEPVCDARLRVNTLHATEIHKHELPSLIDEIPILCVLATQATGKTVIHEADELRVKETDRIHSMVTQLQKMGANIRSEGDSIVIQGPTPLIGGMVDSFKDHRTAMSLIVAGMIAIEETIVQDVECINTSFPSFYKLLDRIGARYQLVDTP